MNAPVDLASITIPHWLRLQPVIRKAIPFMYGAMDEHDLLNAVLERRMAFFPGQKSFMIAELQNNRRTAHIVLANGDDEELLVMRAGQVEEWAARNGAVELTTDVRPGIERLEGTGRYRDHGFTKRSVRYVKELCR